MVYGGKDNKLYGITKTIDIKPLCYHHKIATTPITQSN